MGTPATSAVFRHLHGTAEAATKQEIARATGLSLPTVYQALAQLQELGLIEERDERESTGGRRAATFGTAYRRHAAIGISLTGHSIRGVAVDLAGRRVEDLYVKRSLRTVRSRDALAACIAQTAAHISSKLEERGMRTVGAGVAVPSAIEPVERRLVNLSVLHLSDADVSADSLTRGLPWPADVFNDANCGGFSQCFNVPGTSSATAPDRNGAPDMLAYLSLERGVGGSIIIDGKPFAGPRGTTAEFGHICIEPGGQECACGNLGCLEAYCSSNVLSEEIGCTIEEFFARAGRGDAQVRQILDAYIEHLALGIHDIHIVLGCDVALGGELASYLDPYFEKISDLTRALDPFEGSRAYLRRAVHPHHGVPVGAAQLMLQRFIESV